MISCVCYLCGVLCADFLGEPSSNDQPRRDDEQCEDELSNSFDSIEMESLTSHNEVY